MKARTGGIVPAALAVVGCPSRTTRTDERPARGAAWRTLARECGVARTWGDCYGYLLVATGRAEIMVDDIVNPWDAAALQPIIVEAGGVFTSWQGASTAFGGDAIATNAALAASARAFLTGGDPMMTIA